MKNFSCVWRFTYCLKIQNLNLSPGPLPGCSRQSSYKCTIWTVVLYLHPSPTKLTVTFIAPHNCIFTFCTVVCSIVSYGKVQLWCKKICKRYLNNYNDFSRSTEQALWKGWTSFWIPTGPWPHWTLYTITVNKAGNNETGMVCQSTVQKNLILWRWKAPHACIFGNI